MSGDTDLNLITSGEQPSDTADPVVLDMVLHHPREIRDALRVESGHMDFDATTAENSSVARSHHHDEDALPIGVRLLVQGDHSFGEFDRLCSIAH